jgi:hypothetical protein
MIIPVLIDLEARFVAVIAVLICGFVPNENDSRQIAWSPKSTIGSSSTRRSCGLIVNPVLPEYAGGRPSSENVILYAPCSAVGAT